MERRRLMSAFFLAAAGSCLVLSGCLGDRQGAVERVLTVADCGETVHLQKGMRFSVALDTDPSSGCLWRVGEHDAKALDLCSKELVPKSEDDGSGFGYLRVYEFKARATGPTKVRFLLMASDEDFLPVDDIELDIYVEPELRLASAR